MVDIWQGNNELCALAGSRLKFNIPMVFFDRLKTDGEAQTGALACFLGGKERLKDTALMFRRYTFAIIRDNDPEFVIFISC